MKKLKVYVIFFIVIGLLLLTINFLNGYFSERVEVYISNKTTIYASSYIEEAIRKEVVNNIDIDKLYYMNKGSDDIVTSVLINTNQVNQIMAGVNKSINESLNELDNTTLELPLGIILGETLFSNMPPNLKIHIYPVGRYTCDVMTDISEYGINNSLFQIYIKVAINIDTVIPLKKGMSTIECHIPVAMQIIQGTVPRYYYNTKNLIPDVYDN